MFLLARVLRDEGVIVVFYSDRNMDLMLSEVKKHFRFIQIGVWHKTNPPPAMTGVGFQQATELFVVARKGKKHYFNKALGQAHNVISAPLCSSNQRVHPAEKPVKVFYRIIERFSRPGDLILDPFAGVGTTGKAAKILGRNFICIEKDETFAALAHEALNAPTP